MAPAVGDTMPEKGAATALDVQESSNEFAALQRQSGSSTGGSSHGGATERQVLSGVSGVARRGELVGMLGPSGESQAVGVRQR